MVICVKNVVDGCDTNEQGIVVYRRMRSELGSGRFIVLDFSGVSNVTSSFVNSAIVQLIDDLGYDFVRKFVAIKGVNRQIGMMLRDRMDKLAA